MDIEEKNDSSGIVKKTRHIRISRRDSIVNDLKNSTGQGIISFLLSLAALGLTGVSVYISYRAAGKAGYEAGILIVAAVAVCIVSLVFAVSGFKNHRKIRHYMERRGLLISAMLLAGLLFIYIYQLVQLLN